LRSGEFELYPPSLWVSRELCERIYVELMESMADMGFKVCMALGGHYPADLLLRDLEKRMNGRIGNMLFYGGGTCELLKDEIEKMAKDDPTLGGHGGMWESALVMAAETVAGSGGKFRAAAGARTASDLLFVDRLKAMGETRLATDDGSAGHHGFVTELAEKLAAERRPDMILTCGPEPMMAAMVELAGRHNIPIQCSLERYMKCGLGICGSCQLGKYTVCRDGPVFTGEQLAGIEEFGKWKRDAAGNPVWF
jgi:hypothetical protein